MTQKTTRIERQHAVLVAANVMLENASIDWSSGLTFDTLAAATGIDRATIARDFGSKAELVDRLVEFCLTPGKSRHEWTPGFLEQVDQLVRDAELSLSERFERVGNLNDAFIKEDARIGPQMLLWSIARHEDQTRDLLSQLYRSYDDQHVRVFLEFLSDWAAPRGIHLRTGITSRETMVLLTAVAEGLAIRREVDPHSVPDGLTGRAFVAILQSVLHHPDGLPEALGDPLDAL